MNLYWAWTEPLWRLLAANLVPFTSVYRPLGAALYRAAYFLGGFDPFPFRIAVYALLLANVWLLYLLAVRLSGSRFVGIMAALAGSFHKRALDLYTNNGTLYDVLCFTMTVASMLIYVRLRETPTILRWAAFYLAVTAALNSKEMAVTLPVLLLAYECLYRKSLWSGPLSLAAALAAGTLVARLWMPNQMSGNAAYSLDISLPKYFATSGSYLSDLFYLPPASVPPYGVVAVYGLVLSWALFSGRADLRFAAIWIIVTPLPVAFIAQRGFFVMYLPLAGWAVYLAVLLDQTLEAILRAPPEHAFRRKARVAFVASTAALLATAHTTDHALSWRETSEVQQFALDMKRLQPSLPTGARLLFLNDPFAADSWTAAMVAPLLYRDASIGVDLVKMTPSTLQNRSAYTFVFDWQNSSLVRAR